MNSQRHRYGVVLCTGVLYMLPVLAMAGQQQGKSDVQTPAEITIQPTPPGSMFADVNGYTLYVSERDLESGKSSCTAQCAADWTPVHASADAKPFGAWTLVAREDGTRQWAYKDRPLYRYAKETRPRWADGQSQLWRYALVESFPARGAFGRQGLGGAAAGAGAAAAGAAAAAAAGAQGAAGLMRRGPQRVEIKMPQGVPGGITAQTSTRGPMFADGKGFTLYTSTAAASCTAQCLDSWTPLSAPLLAAVPAGDWSIVRRSDGTLQWAYKSKPLYRSVKDIKAGDANGEDNDWHALPVPAVPAVPSVASATPQ